MLQDIYHPETAICINRIRLKFKVLKPFSMVGSVVGINRIRLEFKDDELEALAKKYNRINRIRLEFKGQTILKALS